MNLMVCVSKYASVALSLLEPILIFVLVFFALFYQFFLHMQM